MRTGLMAVVMATALAGCAQNVAWVRPETPLAQAQDDLQECQSLAFREAQSSVWWSDPFYPYPFSRRFGYSYAWPGRFQSSSLLREQQLQSFCMRARGYQLEVIDSSQP